MLYTNKTLELAKYEDKEGLFLELSSIYGEIKRIPFKPNDKVFEENDWNITIGKFPFNLSNRLEAITDEEDKDLYMIIDTYNYKCFGQHGNLFIHPDNIEDIKILKKITSSNRNKKCFWNIFIIKVKDYKEKNIKFKMINTSNHSFTIELKDSEVVTNKIFDKNFKDRTRWELLRGPKKK